MFNAKELGNLQGLDSMLNLFQALQPVRLYGFVSCYVMFIGFCPRELG